LAGVNDYAALGYGNLPLGTLAEMFRPEMATAALLIWKRMRL
jgi:hypothetical protein